jgi:chemotaxis protein methyltransferase CheR
MITLEQFDRTRQLALRLTGIELFERHREIIFRRSRRLGILDAPAYDLLLDEVDAGEKLAARRLVHLLTTNHSTFFRHSQHFDLAAEHALWSVHRRGQARLWCAAAATGQEPYSLAMSVINVFQRLDPPVNILATDIDEDALAVAKLGEYSPHELEGIDAIQRTDFFAPSVKGNRWKISRQAQSLVQFEVLNLSELNWNLTGQFDVIFCRNVLMYLEPSIRERAIEKLAGILAPDGMLLVDPAEHLGKFNSIFSRHGNGLYYLGQRAEAGTRRKTTVGALQEDPLP